MLSRELEGATCVHVTLRHLFSTPTPFQRMCLLKMAAPPEDAGREVMLRRQAGEVVEGKVLFDSVEDSKKKGSTSSKTYQKPVFSDNYVRGAQSLLVFLVLGLACVAAFSTRLFAVIRFESIIHEFDPW